MVWNLFTSVLTNYFVCVCVCVYVCVCAHVHVCVWKHPKFQDGNWSKQNPGLRHFVVHSCQRWNLFSTCYSCTFGHCHKTIIYSLASASFIIICFQVTNDYLNTFAPDWYLFIIWTLKISTSLLPNQYFLGSHMKLLHYCVWECHIYISCPRFRHKLIVKISFTLCHM